MRHKNDHYSSEPLKFTTFEKIVVFGGAAYFAGQFIIEMILRFI